MATKTLFGKGVRAGAFVTAAGLCFVALAGCSSSTGDSEGSASGELEILVSSASASDAAFAQMNEAFEAAYPDIEVTMSSVDNSTYPATKSSRLTAGNVDIVVLKSFVETPEFAADSTSDDVLLAQAGGLVDLTEEDFMDNYTPSVLDSQAVDGEQYAIPTGLSYSTGVYYNKAIFEELGLSVPTTWSELQTVMSTLSTAGVTPFGIGGKDTWPAGLIMLGGVASLYPTADDKNELVEALWDNSTSLADGTALEVLERTQEIYEHGQANFAGTGYDELPASFAAGSFAMTVDGTWNEPTIATAVADAFEIGYFPLPISDDAAANAFLNGKIELQLGVASNAPNKDAAMAWMEFFSEPENYQAFVETSGFSPSQPDIEVSEFLTSIDSYTSTFQPAWDTLWVANNAAGQDAVYPFNYPALSPLGSDDAEQAAQSAQTAWEGAF